MEDEVRTGKVMKPGSKCNKPFYLAPAKMISRDLNVTPF